MRRVGVLMGLVANDPEAQSRAAAFENGLRELGWVKGRNLSIEYRWAGDGNPLRDHAAELLAMGPDLILAFPGSFNESTAPNSPRKPPRRALKTRLLPAARDQVVARRPQPESGAEYS
jgi:hypothetical protein